jgi:hypothetical protein
MRRLALVLTAALCLLAPASAQGARLIDLGDFDQPIYVAAPPGDNSRLMVVQKEGLIQVLEGGGQSTFLDVPAAVGGVHSADEQGLLSMAFAPDYAASGRFYVYYTAADGSANRVDEFRVSANRSVADAGSRRPVISIPHATATNHNGGTIAFGPDGMLYIAPGDGGNTPELAQDNDSLSGKVLRIDPRSGATYGIPPGNPFAGPTPGADEVFHVGLRNPFRFSFDRGSGDLIIGDVGSSGPNRTEEVTLLPAGTPPARNLGWDECEGTTCPGTEPTGHFKPALQYQRTGGATAVTGGVVVRDSAIPELVGRYIYADFFDSPIRAATLTAQAAAGDGAPTGLGASSIVAFNEDNGGCVYVTSLGGDVFRLAPDSGPAPVPCAGPSQQPPPGGGNGQDVTPPLLSARVRPVQRVLRNRGAIGYGRCNELCQISMTARLRIGKLAYPLRTARARRRAGRRARLNARLTRRSRRALRRALARGRRARVVVVLSATDPAGNTSRRVRFRIRVRR